MSVPADSSAGPRLDACGCCQPATAPPIRIFNRPGQRLLAYRVDTHPTALRRMLSQLATTQRRDDAPDRRPLRALSTQASDDPAIALLDAWATVTDVLTFYQERIANEGYLRTATERRSVLELARAVGYELNPGVAAGAVLAFTVEDAPGAPGTATVPEGTKVQSIPSQGHLPQTFETSETLQARADWNALRPLRTSPQKVASGTTDVFLKGIATQLQPGDLLLFVGAEREAASGSERWDARIVESVTAVPPDPRDPADEGHTTVTWRRGLGSIEPLVNPATDPQVYVFRLRAALFGHNAPDFRLMPESLKDALEQERQESGDSESRGAEWPNFRITTAEEQRFDLDADYPRVLAGSWLVLAEPDYRELYRVVAVQSASRTDFTLTARTTRVEVDTAENLSRFGLRDTVVFAQSEPLPRAESPRLDPLGFSPDDYPSAQTPDGRTIVLDRLVSGLRPGQMLVVGGKRPRAKVAPGVTLTLTADDGSGRQVILQPGEVLRLLRPLAPSPAGPTEWHLATADGFVGAATADPGQILLRPAEPDDPAVSEVVFLDDGPDAVGSDRQRTRLRLRVPLTQSYDPASTTINANVVRATHGETVGAPAFGAAAAATNAAVATPGEVLGSGNGAIANQQFALRRPPLTFVSAPTASGARNTLAVRVNGTLWEEVPSLFGLSPHRQSYTVRVDGDGTTRVIFGDGEMGTRVPTGLENVTATYRTGIGLEGMVPAGALALLQVRPLGIRTVVNSLPSSGAADPEALEDARTNAPLTILTLDRVVSLRDFEDFARSFAGVGKAQAVELWSGTERIVHITVAGADGAAVPTTSDLYRNLVRAIDAGRDPGHRVEVATYTPRRFRLQARLRIDPRRLPDEVLSRVGEALRTAFAFERRSFGQPVTSAEVIATAQGVDGVVGVDLDALEPDEPLGSVATTRPPTTRAAAQPASPSALRVLPEAVLPARRAQLRGDGTIAPAELLVVNPTGITLEAITT